MTCTVPTCSFESGDYSSFKPFPHQTVLSERWIESIQKGCGQKLNLLDFGECQVCDWHFVTSDEELLEPRRFIASDGKLIETSSCRLCLKFFLSSEMLDIDCKIGDIEIKSLISETLEIGSELNDLGSKVCMGCLVRLELLQSIQNNFLNAEIKLQNLRRIARRSQIEMVDVDVSQELIDYIVDNGTARERSEKEVTTNASFMQTDEQEEYGNELSGREDSLLDELTTSPEKTETSPRTKSTNNQTKAPKHTSKEAAARSSTACHICGMSFPTTKDLRQHSKRVHAPDTKNISTCKLCDFQAYSIKLRAHIETVHQNETYPYHKCLECSQTFFTYRAWYMHGLSHTDRYACTECGKRCASLQQLQDHTDRNHPNGQQFECTMCPPGKVFRTSLGLRNHLNVTHGSARHQCEFCQKRFKVKQNLDTHRRTHTGEKPFECKNCSKRFSDRSKAHHHQKRCGGEIVRIHSELDLIPAEIKDTTATPKEASSIKDEPKSDPAPADNNDEEAHQFRKCPKCPRTFFSYGAWYAHSLVHKGKEREQDIRSSQLLKQNHAEDSNSKQKRFTHKHLLDIHRRKHTGEKPVDSEDDSAVDKSDTSITEPSVLDPRPEKNDSKKRPQNLECTECPRTFSTKSALYAHSMLHTDRFLCKECDKRFSDSTQLQAHMEGNHSGGKRFECEVCPGKFFNTSLRLYVHMNQTHGELKYECEYCQKRFKRKQHLDRHRRTHTGERPFECKNCLMRFGDPSLLCRHKMICGKEKVTKK